MYTVWQRRFRRRTGRYALRSGTDTEIPFPGAANGRDLPREVYEQIGVPEYWQIRAPRSASAGGTDLRDGLMIRWMRSPRGHYDWRICMQYELSTQEIQHIERYRDLLPEFQTVLDAYLHSCFELQTRILRDAFELTR